MFLLLEPLFQLLGKDKGTRFRLLFRKTSLQFLICTVFHRVEAYKYFVINVIQRLWLSFCKTWQTYLETLVCCFSCSTFASRLQPLNNVFLYLTPSSLCSVVSPNMRNVTGYPSTIIGTTINWKCALRNSGNCPSVSCGLALATRNAS